MSAIRFKSYAASLLSSLGLMLGGVLALNCAVDPLWHFNGNVVTGKNIAFNERESKLRRAQSQVAATDCVIYGSSRATLLDAGFFHQHRCYNMAVSGGTAAEFPYYADALSRMGGKPEFVVIGADDLSFFGVLSADNVPAWVREKRRAPRWYQDYLSIDALEFSIRALSGKSPIPRYYRPDFSIAIEEGRRVYRPDAADLMLDTKQPVTEVDGSQAREPGEFLPAYQQLVAMTQADRVVIYVPPISLWAISDMVRKGELADYLEAIYQLTTLGWPVLDFSVPSAVTSDPSRTYDGSHYNLDVNRQIAAAVETDSPTCGPCIRVDKVSLEQYRARFETAYADWVKRVLSD